MLLPMKMQILLGNYLDSLRNSPNHVLNTDDRINIYQAFGPSRIDKYIEDERSKPKNRPFTFFPSEDDLDELIEDTPTNIENLIQKYETQFANFTVADYAQSWLAILTVERVLFVWEDWNWDLYALADHPKKDARRIINTARGFLQKTMSFRKIFDLFCGEFNFGLNIDNWVPYQIYCVYAAAYFALDFIIVCGNAAGLNITVPFNNYDEAEYDKDFATAAVKAYSAIDRNPLGEYKLWPDEFDIKKRLEFWEWWLTEAIPQAWELAQQSTNQ